MLKLVDFSDSIIKVLGKSPLLILTCINESNLKELYFIYFTSLHKWRKMYFICWPQCHYCMLIVLMMIMILVAWNERGTSMAMSSEKLMSKCAIS